MRGSRLLDLRHLVRRELQEGGHDGQQLLHALLHHEELIDDVLEVLGVVGACAVLLGAFEPTLRLGAALTKRHVQLARLDELRLQLDHLDAAAHQLLVALRLLLRNLEKRRRRVALRLRRDRTAVCAATAAASSSSAAAAAERGAAQRLMELEVPQLPFAPLALQPRDLGTHARRLLDRHRRLARGALALGRWLLGRLLAKERLQLGELRLAIDEQSRRLRGGKAEVAASVSQ